jgi:steroid delta-isomerase-like uncharacterized protein
MSQLSELVQRYYDMFNRRDFAGYDKVFTADCLIECPGIQLRGIDGARGFDSVWQTAMPDAQIVNLRKATAANLVMCENHYRGTHTGPLTMPEGTLPASGRKFDRPYMAVFELEGERIKRQTLHFDRATVMQDLGPVDMTAKNLEIARGIYDAFNRRDLQYILDHLDDNVSWGIESVAHEVPPYGILTGKQNVPRFFAAWGEHCDYRSFAASDFVAAGEHVFNTLSYDLTVKATGKRLVNSGCSQHWTFKNGKIVRWRGWEDTAATRDAFHK